MGFISFNEKYYQQKLETLENSSLSGTDIYEAKQLLKVLDDLSDEGYTILNMQMEADFSCISRLRKLIRNAGDIPFAIGQTGLPETAYGAEEQELTVMANRMMTDAGTQDRLSDHSFLQDVLEYCKWIGYEKDVAYVFLFRDAFLPYVYFKSRKRQNVHAWLISRRFLTDMTHTADVDDNIRLPIYEALESGYAAFPEFSRFCKDRILPVLDEHIELKRVLTNLLSSIREKHIVVIESGYCGTIPMMLKSMDDRVTFRLFTTAPFLYETYRDHIFCRRYEDIRKFETLYSQDLYMQYASYRDSHFYVRVSENPEVQRQSLAEIKRFLR